MTCPLFNSGSVVITKDNYYEILPQIYERTVGTTITAFCNEGLFLVGNAQFVCQNDRTWSYNPKPYCTSTTAAPTKAPAPDENTWILIGVVCGVAFIIIAILVIMICAIWYRDRKRRKEEALMMYNVNRMYHDRPDSPVPPYTRDEEFEMYGRSAPPPPPPPLPPPPPYESGSKVSQDRYHYEKNREYDRRRHYDRYRDRDPYYEKRPRDSEYLSDVGRRSFHDYDGERRSHLSARMYLPESEYERTNPRSLYHKSRSFDDLSEHERRPYDGPWMRRSFKHHTYDDMFYDRPRDSRLWRNA